MQPDERIGVANQLGECVLWNHASQSLWWTDIEARRLYRLDWQTRALETFETPARLAAFGFVENRHEFIAAFDCGFALYDPARGIAGNRLRPEGLKKGHRLNDGRVDRSGRFWCGSMVEDHAEPHEAQLYCLADGRTSAHLDGIGIANGLCWSPDGTVCYFADTLEKTIWRFAFDRDCGVLSGREEFARISRGAPDGATVDAEGFLWSAQWGGGCVTRYAPDGRIDRVLDVPAEQPTCVAFGGPGLDLLFVTSARTGLGRSQAGDGDLFMYNVGIRGLPECRFRLDGLASITGAMMGSTLPVII